ncbi:uncharacterized protein FTOL_12035 [Fusarium torulosum]|uniref:SCP domain-containing protein n=1 Tax=Fusarium torulosum TaxID=33205 RepID=A0AAE8ML12_9HYPO|nr:uncharacterized protein FTOL_12035 [Fusarium torulosum]
MATTSLYRALLIVGLLACLAASNDSRPNFGGDCTGPNPEPLDQNYNIPYSPADHDRETSDKARVKVAPRETDSSAGYDEEALDRARRKTAPEILPSPPSKRQEGIKIYSCGGEGTRDHKRQEHNSCGCNSGRKHSPPTKRRDHTNCGCNSGNKNSPSKRQEGLNFHGCSGKVNQGHKHQEHNSSASVPEAKPSPSPVPVEMYQTYPGSDLAVPASELEVLKQWAAEGKYTGCNSGMKNKLPKRDHLEMYPTYPGSDLAVPASELQVLKQWAAEGKHPEITANMNKHPLSKRLPPSFDSFEDVKKHREELKEHKQQLSREKALQEDRDSYERQRIAAIADVDVKIERTRAPGEDGDLPVLIKIKITNNSKWKITFCDKTSPISSNAYKMGFFEVISHELRANIAAPANSTSAMTQPTWGECSRDLYSGESASTWITFPPPGAPDYPNLGSLGAGHG